jgi:hypothetical protein
VVFSAVSGAKKFDNNGQERDANNGEHHHLKIIFDKSDLAKKISGER